MFEYLAARYAAVDVVAFRQNGAEICVPRARDLLVLDLPAHSRTTAARAARNLRRYLINRPPLIDRFSGFSDEIRKWLEGRRYQLIVVEHFWCAPYAPVLRPSTARLVLDLHNIESELHRTLALASGGPLSLMHNRFANSYTRLQREWLPRYDDVLATSSADAHRIEASHAIVYPNTIPRYDLPRVPREHAIAFSGNMEYEPNLSAVRWFAREVWPLVRREEPSLEWRLVGRNAHAIRNIVAGVAGVRITGEVPDAVEEIARTKVAVAPLLAGSGTRFKILEAWAAATPVVSTVQGAEGLDAIDRKHLLIAEGARPFADAVVATVRKPGRLGCNGRDFYLDRYTIEAGWRVLAQFGL